MKPTLNKVPRHIALILDGNRRFAKRLMLKPNKGHKWGAKKVDRLFDWCKELNIKELTLYVLSLENFNRPKYEFNYLMDLFRNEFDRLRNDSRLNEVKINFIGRIWMFPKDIQETMSYLMNKTKNNRKFILNFAMAYGGRAEVIDAIKKLAKDIKNKKVNIDKINEKTFSKNLYLDDEPDLIIRTGGEHRTSNFLIWQSYYSEWVFLDVLWPEFSKKDFVKCLDDYAKRERRFGK